MNYRPDIDGLRALAVLSVILCHAGFKIFAGGFVGVDIFFVISGYLICSIIKLKIETQSFSYSDFYMRRLRRIFPAFITVLIVTSVFSWLWLLPDDMVRFCRSLISSLTLSSNYYFWKTSGYFDISAQLKPLLHTWSLSVEEQFYLLFPVFYIFLFNNYKRFLLLYFLAILFLSLIFAQWGSNLYSQFTYYSIHSRVFEFSIGIIVSIVGFNRYFKKIGDFSFLGLFLIVFSVLFFDSSIGFPGFWTLIPTIGAALILLNHNRNSFAYKILKTKPLVYLGLFSYSAYLWHQPIFAFARYKESSELSFVTIVSLIVITLILSYISYRYIEKPFRNENKISNRSLISLLSATVLCLVCFGIFGLKGYEGRFDKELNSRISPAATDFDVSCNLTETFNNPFIKSCIFGKEDSKTSLVLYGDSHSHVLFSDLNIALKNSSIKGIYIENSACLLPNIFDSRLKFSEMDCFNSTSHLYGLLNKIKPDYLILSIRWSYRLFPIPSYIESLGFDNQEGGYDRFLDSGFNYSIKDGSKRIDGDFKKYAIYDFLNHLRENTNKLLLVYPIPEAGWNVPRLNFFSYINNGKINEMLSTSYDAFNKRNLFVNQTLDNYGKFENLIRIKPEHLFCDSFVSKRCVVQLNHNPLYYDDNHLSRAGASMLVNSMLPYLN